MDNATAHDVLAVDTQIDSIRRYLHYKYMPPQIRTILETEIQRLTETKLRIYVSSQFRKPYPDPAESTESVSKLHQIS
jgi:hypothetical protein